MPNIQQNPTWFIDQLTLYQAANSSPEAIKRNFLIRIAEFELIISDLRRKKSNDPLQHELILGRRGSGKSTLLRRIQIEIDEDVELTKQFIAINLAEEQASIYRLSDLWFEVLQELMTRLNSPLRLRDFDDFDDNQAYTRYLYAEIHQLLQSSGKRIVLLLDNLDRILQNFDDDGHLLRETLLNYNDLQIIGGSTRMDEHFWRYDKPFYEFFRRHRLEGLRFEEIHQLLNHWSEEMHLPLLHDYALRYRGRIEAIRILTDGLPRALQFFIHVLLHDSNSYGFDYLRKVMDRATPLYQERLNNLTPPQRKIIQEMAFWWEAAPTKVLVEKCRMESKLIASYLKQLEQYGIVETISTGKKNHLYRISERFFNMWLIVTQGNPEQKRRAKYLTLFLESWYDGEELKVLAKKHLGDLRDGLVSYDKAMVLSKGLAHSRFIGVEERDALIEYTRKLKPEGQGESELPRKYAEIFVEMDQLKVEGKFAEALGKLEEIENEGDGVKFFLEGYLFDELGKFNESETKYLKSIESGYTNALFNLAGLYEKRGENEKAKSYYLQSVQKGSIDALNNLALLYAKESEHQKAELYYKQAIEAGDSNAMNNLGACYAEQGRIEEAEVLYNQAIIKGINGALNNLAVLLFETNRNSNTALEYVRRYNAVEQNDSRLGNLLLIEVWNGIFENLTEKIEHIFQISQGEDMTWFLSKLLYLEQNQLLLSFFESDHHGKMLRERYELLYYATLILTHKTEDNLLLKIPPEVLPTVQEIVEKVKRNRRFIRKSK